MELKQVRALITGGSSGIGLATASAITAAGGKAVIAARNPERLEKATKQSGAFGVRADVQQGPDVQRMFNVAEERIGELNVVINNAGYGYVAPLLEIDAARFEQVWRTNVLGAMLVAKEAAQRFVDRKAGTLINVGSTSALRGSAGASPYNATKFALRGMTEAWRRELRSHGVRVMLVNPSEVMTNFASAKLDAAGETQKRAYTKKEQLSKLRAEEIAQAITGLIALDERALITEVEVWALNPEG